MSPAFKTLATKTALSLANLSKKMFIASEEAKNSNRGEDTTHLISLSIIISEASMKITNMIDKGTNT